MVRLWLWDGPAAGDDRGLPADVVRPERLARALRSSIRCLALAVVLERPERVRVGGSPSGRLTHIEPPVSRTDFARPVAPELVAELSLDAEYVETMTSRRHTVALPLLEDAGALTYDPDARRVDSVSEPFLVASVAGSDPVIPRRSPSVRGGAWGFSLALQGSIDRL